MRLFRSLGRKTLISSGKVQMTTLVSVCQRAHLPLADKKVRITIRYLRMLPDSLVKVAKGGVVDKSGAFAPTYPQFVMRNSDLLIEAVPESNKH